MISRNDFLGCSDDVWERIKKMYARTGYVEAYNIDCVWRDVIDFCVLCGEDYLVTEGSYVGQIRKQLKNLIIKINKPWLRPLTPIVDSGLFSTTTEIGIGEYFATKLMSDIPAENEEYTYGLWIVPQIQGVIDKLNRSCGGTNQATISVGDSGCINMADPPCLRLIDFKVVDRRLVMSVFFRSWDIVCALPENLGGFQLLKEYVLSNLTFPCDDGEIIAYSSGAHIYSQYEGVVNSLCVNKMVFDPRVLIQKLNFEKINGK